MVQINFAQKTVNAKIVYYGPGMSGKTTNLEIVHQRAPSQNRGDLTSISTDGDRTLFFDYMPLDLGTVAGMRTAFQIYTVPGQVYYNSTRKLVLQGVDGVVFVADSSAAMLEQNLESLRNLEENLAEYGKSLATLPHVIQWNKRDLPDAMPVAELDRHLNRHGAPTFEAVANVGQGVFPTLKALAAAVIKNIMQESNLSKARGGAQPRPQAAAPRAAAPAAPAPAARPAPAPTPGVEDPWAPQAQPAAGAAPAAHRAIPLDDPAPAPARAAAPAVDPYAAARRAASAPVAAPPAPETASPGAMMKTRAAVRPGAAPATRSHVVPTQRAAARRASPDPAPAAQPIVRRARGGGVFTAVFVAVAAGVGGLLTWAILNVL